MAESTGKSPQTKRPGIRVDMLHRHSTSEPPDHRIDQPRSVAVKDQALHQAQLIICSRSFVRWMRLTDPWSQNQNGPLRPLLPACVQSPLVQGSSLIDGLRSCEFDFAFRDKEQKVPRTFPSEESTGFDQEARSPYLNAEARCSGTAQSGSVAMSETMTRDPRNAAVPQDPAHGPIGRFSICCVHPLGRLGPATESR